MTESQDSTPTVRAPQLDETVPGGVAQDPTGNALRRGQTLGRYIVVEPLGQGAMGAVYKAFDPELDRTVAIKLLLRQGGATDSARLTREAQAMARISHPNVIAVYDVGTREDQVFFAMELVDGVSLRHWLRDTTRAEDDILDVFLQAGAGMAAAHGAGVIHRDFKPDNVLVDSQGRARVLDFGLARRHAGPSMEEVNVPSQSSLSVDLTRTGTIMGTPAYMAPEQYTGEAADARSDQFAFCVALYEALAGERPFQGDDLKSLRTAVLENDRVPAPAGRIPAEIAAVLDRGLQRDPEDRFGSMDALLEALTPRRGPRWGAIVAGGTLVGGLVIASAYGLGRQSAATSQLDPCADVTARMDAAWTKAERAAVVKAFLDSGAFNAASMAERTVSALDDFAARWRESAARSCAMVEVEHSLTERLSARSRRCLDGAASGFDEELKSLRSVDARGVQGSLDGVDTLPNPEECVEINLLELQVDPPSEPERRAQLRDVGRVHRAVMDRYWAGDPQGCLDGFGEYEELVGALDHGSTTARMLASRSQCELAAGHHERASTTRERSFEAALAAADDLTAVNLAAEVAYVITTRTDDLDAADTWVRRGEALLQRHALQNTLHAAGLLNSKAVLADRRGEHEASIEIFKELVELTRGPKVPTEHHLTALSNVGAGLANIGRVDEAMEWLEAAASFAEARYGEDHMRTALQRSRVAQGLVVQGLYAEAEGPQRQALAVLRRAQPQGSIDQASAIKILGVIQRKLGDTSAALELYREAYAMRAKLDALETVTATGMLITLGTLLLESGEVAEAEDVARMVLRLRKSGGSPPVELAEGHLTLSRVLEARDDRTGALEHLERAQELALSAEERTAFADRGVVMYSVAQHTLALGDASRALELFERAESLTRDEGTGRRAAAGRLDYAELLRQRDREDEAKALVSATLRDLESSPYPKTVHTRALALQSELQ